MDPEKGGVVGRRTRSLRSRTRYEILFFPEGKIDDDEFTFTRKTPSSISLVFLPLDYSPETV